MQAALILLALAVPWAGEGARYLTYGEVRDVAVQFAEAPEEPAWEAWTRETDKEIRQRVARGAEDSVTNLLLYGASFTGLPRLAGPFEAGGAGPRIRALAAALAGTPDSERLRTARRAIGGAGKSAAEIEKILAANLARFAS